MSDVDHGQLNMQGINVIRLFQDGGRPMLWGARTTATNRNWQYVNVRRLMLYLEESIQEGIRWAVFEPNNLGLWQKLKRTITEFLTRVWRDGALFGATAEEAFYVRIDEILNPPSERALAWFVREPFPSVSTGTSLDHGLLSEGERLTIYSEMGEGGVVFADGIESDRLDFLSGQVLTLGLAERSLNLVVPVE